MRHVNDTATTRRRCLGITCLSMASLMGIPCAAQALEWPDKPVKIIIPFSAGGATDSLGRALALELGKRWKQSVIVDNRPGARRALGANGATKAAPEGQNLNLTSGSMFTVNPFIYQKPPYSIDSFEMITKVASGPMVITVNAALPVKSLKELIAWAKNHPGVLHFVSAGNGSKVHMAGESFADAAGIEMIHVPYKGEGPAYSDLTAGICEVAVANINTMVPLLKGDRLRALVDTSHERSVLLPNIPTAAEAGLPGFDFISWFGLMAPAGTAKSLRHRIYEDLRSALDQPGLKRYFQDLGMTPVLSEPGTLAQDIAREQAHWKTLIAKRGIHVK